jgi:hypothetical protein
MSDDVSSASSSALACRSYALWSAAASGDDGEMDEGGLLGSSSRRRCPGFGRCIGFELRLDIEGRSSEVARAVYVVGWGTRKNGKEIKTNTLVPIDNSRRSPEVLPGRAKADIMVKNRALKPNAESGKPVAVPRCRGQFKAAEYLP